jgi:hypothetical protein
MKFDIKILVFLAIIATSLQQCTIPFQTTSVETTAGLSTYTMLLNIASPTGTCTWTCTLKAGTSSVNGALYAKGSVSGNSYYFIKFLGLTPNTQYSGQCTGVSSKKRALKSFKFLQKNQQSGAFSFIFPRDLAITKLLAFGDWGSSTNSTMISGVQSSPGGVNGWNTLNFLQANRTNYYDGFLFCGDLAYNLHNQEYYNPGQAYLADNGAYGNMWMTNIGNFLQNQPFFFSPGNHEAMEMNSKGSTYSNVRSRFFMPNWKVSMDDYYSFDVNNVHVVEINSNIWFQGVWEYPVNATRQTAALQWLQNDIASSTKKWKILFLHAPFYCSLPEPTSDGRCGPGADSLRSYLETSINGKFDLVISGHVHFYERTLPTNNKLANMIGVSVDNSTYTNPSNPAYVVCGAPGNIEQGLTLSSKLVKNAMSVIVSAEQGICELAITADSLTLTYTSTNPTHAGKQIDQFTIKK